MGRHSSETSWSYYRSLLGYFLPWALVALIAVGGVWVGVGALGQDELATKPPVAHASPTPSPSETVVEATPTPVEAPKPKGHREGVRGDGKVALITDGMTVQVLNGSNDAAADDAMASKLAGLGYQVIAIDGSSVRYTKTTVLWSYAESREAAEALAQHFGWRVEPKPDNLSTSVAMHVIVGDDET